jgi:hypothetical protein
MSQTHSNRLLARTHGYLDHHPGPLCRKEVCDHFSPRQRHQVASLPACPRRRHRALPLQGHPPHVKEEAGQEEQGQALRQAGQLCVTILTAVCGGPRLISADTHIMPTRYTLELENLKGVVSADTFKEVSQREEAKKTVKKAFEERYTSGKNRWFFTPLQF